MSLNSTEIDRVLRDLPEGPHFLSSIHSPSYHRYYLNFESLHRSFCLSICLQAPFLRVAILPGGTAPKGPAHRFLASLRKSLLGARLDFLEHYLGERVLAFQFFKDAQTPRLYVRLWTGASNLFLTTPTLTILDAAFLRPKRGEVPGKSLVLPEKTDRPPPPAREFLDSPGETYSQRLERFYREQEYRDRLQSASKRYAAYLEGTLNSLIVKMENLEGQLEDDGSQDRHLGDLLMANLHLLRPGMTEFEAEDWEGGKVSIKLDPRLSPPDQAGRFYERARKARERVERSREEIDILRGRIERLRQEQNRLISEPGNWVIEAANRIQKWKASRDTEVPGLRLLIRGYPVLVGRNARENDLLLRTFAKGRDHWIHTRDYPGGYVFIRCPVHKTVPLDVLLDAAQLAAHFSKARDKGKVDFYWTRVKYLRRAREGKKGTVIPTQEKNLSIETNPRRVRELLEIRDGT